MITPDSITPGSITPQAAKPKLKPYKQPKRPKYKPTVLFSEAKKRDPKFSSKIYPAINNQTIINVIGKARWKVIKEAIRKKYKTEIIIIQFTQPTTVRVGGPEGPMIGKLATVEKWAIKFSKEKR